MTPPLIGIAGWKNSGKTTMAERLVGELARRGFRVSTVKHAHHDADLDQQGSDTFRHRAAGASEVALVTGRRWAMLHELREEAEPGLRDIVERLSPCDLVVVEGFKRDDHPKIEVRRREARDTAPLADTVPNVVAIAADHSVADKDRPVFDIDDVAAIADFVVGRFLARTDQNR